VAAGYVLYGSSVMFVYTALDEVNGFTLDPSVGSFLLSHSTIKTPEAKREYSINDGYAHLFDKGLTNYLGEIKSGEKPYSIRYIGTLVADMHRTLLKGGLFANPANSQKPNGKLRLMFEVNPFALLVERAGGVAVSNGKNPVEIIPTSVTQTVPVVMGSTREVEKYLTFVEK
jgi:fructose-1,6-bisphosphatase I